MDFDSKERIVFVRELKQARRGGESEQEERAKKLSLDSSEYTEILDSVIKKANAWLLEKKIKFKSAKQ